MVACWGHCTVALSYYRTVVLSYCRTICRTIYLSIYICYLCYLNVLVKRSLDHPSGHLPRPDASRPHPIIPQDLMDNDGNLRATDIGITWAGSDTFLHGVKVVGPAHRTSTGHVDTTPAHGSSTGHVDTIPTGGAS